eukprot:126382-Prorocentrum_minimum.AAC.1
MDVRITRCLNESTDTLKHKGRHPRANIVNAVVRTYILGEKERSDIKTARHASQHANSFACCSFDILRDNLGEARDQWPHSMFMVAGTQAANPKSNSIALMRITSISKTHKPPKVWLSSRGILSAYDLLLSARGMRHRSYRFRVVDFVHHKAGPCCILGFYGKPIGTCRRPRTTMTTTIPRTRIATRTWTRMSRPGPGSLQASRGHQFCTSARWRTAQASTACAAAHRLRSSSPASPTMPTCR